MLQQHPSPSIGTDTARQQRPRLLKVDGRICPVLVAILMASIVAACGPPLAATPTTNGDLGMGDAVPGDMGSGDAVEGDATLGDAGRGDATPGDVPRGDGPAIPPGPSRLISWADIDALSLADLGWNEQSRQVLATGTTMIVGDFSGGPFATLNANGNPHTVSGGLHEAAAIFLPSSFPALSSAASGRGVVLAQHVANLGFLHPADLEMIVEQLGVPILTHGEYDVDWLELGYSGRADMIDATFRSLMATNPCTANDLAFGNFGIKLAEVNMRAITLLSRIVEVESGGVAATTNQVALRGGSKEGAACWYASGADPRISKAACGGYHLEDLQALESYETDWACQGTGPGGGDTSGLISLWHWLNETPAGQDTVAMMSVPEFASVLYPDFFLILGDVGMWNMHDGRKYPIGSETAFLGSLTRPWRYDRKPNDLREADPVRQLRIVYLLAERLLRPATAPENFPKVTSAEIQSNTQGVRVTALVAPVADSVRLWWNHSSSRDYTAQSQSDWQSVAMTLQPDGTYVVSMPSLPPAGQELAWYVEAEVAFMVGVKTLHRRDAAPVRFLFRNPAQSCSGLVVPTFCQ